MKEEKELILQDFPMPDSSHIERKLLCSVLSDMTYFSELLRIVKPEFFSDDKNKVVWCVIVDMYNKGQAVDMTSVYPRVNRKHFNSIIGGEVTYGQAILQLGMALYDTYVKRLAYIRSLSILQEVTSNEGADSILTRFSDFAKEVTDAYESGVAVPCGEVANRLAEKIQSGRIMRIPTPFPQLNYYMYGGLGCGNLIILAARPSVGKTTVGLQMAQCAAMNNYPTTFYSLEMTDEELVQRLIVGTGLVSTLDIVRGQVDWEKYEKAVQMAVSNNLFINDKAKSLDEITTSITLDAQRGRCKVAFVDYLGLINHDDRRKTYAQVIGDVTKRLKNVAKECNIPIVLLCQLNRESAKENRSPQLTDLRDSGSIEQDADVVVMLERPRDAGGVIVENKIDLWVRKNRGGSCNFDNALHLVGNDSYSNFREENSTIIDEHIPDDLFAI